MSKKSVPTYLKIKIKIGRTLTRKKNRIQTGTADTVKKLVSFIWPCQDGQSQRPSWQGERFDAHADCEEEETTDCSAVGLNDEPRPA